MKWWSFNNIIHTAENCRKKIKGLVDEYSKEKDDDFMNLVVGEWGLYKHL
ncbi:MAG: hypothetical protein LBP53_04990 [Candidatus Peribacteria bacterium]|nr:hypothetical protein [Candidatus Peribacteria bacterium]